MGKRELLIVVAFIALGAVAYQFTAPPAKPGQGGFSFSQIWNNARRGIHADRASAEWKSQRTIAVADSVREIRIRDVHGEVRIVGENRTDIAAEFRVQSTGADPTEAQALAKAAELKVLSLDDAIVLHVQYPVGGRQVASLTVKVPKRLAARVDSCSGLDVSNIAATELTNVTGDSTLSSVAGLAAGDFRGGVLEVTDPGSVDLTLNNARATISGTRGTTRLDVRSGRCTIANTQGPVEIESRQAVIEVATNHGPVRIGGIGGRVKITSAGEEVRADMRRTDITADLRQAVPMNLSTTDARVELAVGSPVGSAGRLPAVEVDAVASEGEVRASDWQLAPTKSDRESRLEHAFGNGPRVSLRTQRGDIVLRKLADVEIKKGQ